MATSFFSFLKTKEQKLREQREQDVRNWEADRQARIPDPFPHGQVHLEALNSEVWEGDPEEYLEEAVGWVSNHESSLLRLLMCYMFIEQLSNEFDRKNSALPSLSRRFLRQELNDAEWERCVGNPKSQNALEKYFGSEPFWTTRLREKIGARYAMTQSLTERGDVCVTYCSELVAGIDDADLVARFIDMSREGLKESGQMTDAAEACLLSMEL